MKTQKLDGSKQAQKKLTGLKAKLEGDDKHLSLVSIVHSQDVVGLTYTKLKGLTSDALGIDFKKITVSFSEDIEKIKNIIKDASGKLNATGILIQKPSRTTWEQHYKGDLTFYDWWESLTSQIDPKKDVDCLTRENLENVYRDKSDFLPATAQAVIDILRIALGKDLIDSDFGDMTISIVGKSELVGKPLAAKLSFAGAKTYLLGSKDNLSDFLPRSDVVISATGVNNLITKDLIKENAIVIDVGEPNPDVDSKSLEGIASYVTPVPGGVGPLTVVTLFGNLVKLSTNTH